MFLYRFSNVPELVEGWTTNRERLLSRLSRIWPDGGTAMYDAVAEAVPLAQSGRHRKKALLIISDGNDTNSATTVAEVKRQIRESEVLVYAIGIDSQSDDSDVAARARRGRPASRHSASRFRSDARQAAAGHPSRRPDDARRAPRNGRSRERRRAAGDHRRQRRPHRDRALPARSRSGHRRASPTN